MGSCQECVKDGDTVVEIGAGRGICSVIAAREVGSDGSVVTYDAGKELVEHSRETARLNRVSDRITPNHAIVESGLDLSGDQAGASRVQGSQLSECDVLVMDCEGAELDIIPAIEFKPRHIIVEAHPKQDAGPDVVEGLLKKHGYEMIDERQTSPTQPPEHRVLLSKRGFEE